MEQGSASISLLGGFGFVAHGQPVTLRESGQRLVAFLALNRGLIERQRLAGWFWTDKPNARALGNLRSVLWRMPLGPDEPVQTSGSRVGLAAAVDVDLEPVLTTIARVADGDVRPGDAELVGRAVTSGLLPDWYDDWVIDERERFEQRALHCLDAIASACARQGRYADAIDAALRSVALDPLREASHHALIRAHLAEGNRAEAKRRLGLLDDLLRRELGVAPSPTIVAELQASLVA